MSLAVFQDARGFLILNNVVLVIKINTDIKLGA